MENFQVWIVRYLHMTIHPRSTHLSAALFFILGALPAFAVNRSVTIDAPAQAVAGAKVSITVSASTAAKDGEQIGFFHAEYSVDGGRTWTGFSYDEKLGTTAARTAGFTVGAKGAQAKIRVLVAFRGGQAGDVDFNGAPIRWEDSWARWESPPARLATIDVVEL
jgi:hypothetical protein